MEAKFSNWSFSISSANKWPWWPLEIITFWRTNLLLHITLLLRGHHCHLLALETKNGQFENFVSSPFSVIFHDSWLIWIMAHIFLFTFKFILLKKICIMSLWLMSRKKMTENDQFWNLVLPPFSVIFLRFMGHEFMMHIFFQRINLNANKKIWVIIHMTHESWKMTKNRAEAKFSIWPFSISSTNKWPWWPLETITFWRIRLLLHITVLSRGHHGHLLALEDENGQV